MSELPGTETQLNVRLRVVVGIFRLELRLELPSESMYLQTCLIGLISMSFSLAATTVLEILGFYAQLLTNTS